jgi:hypothetical protein
MIEFKITNSPDQQFSAILDNKRVTLRLRFNTVDNRWSFDLALDDEPILYGRKIVTGVDLLNSFDFGIGILFCLADADNNIEPGRIELPNRLVKLYHNSVN